MLEDRFCALREVAAELCAGGDRQELRHIEYNVYDNVVLVVGVIVMEGLIVTDWLRVGGRWLG